MNRRPPGLAALLLCLLLAAPVGAATAGATVRAADAPLAQGIARTLHQVDGLTQVSVTVSGGVARLDGTVADASDRQLAARIAAQQPGITAVDNRVQPSMRLDVRFREALDQVGTKLVRLVAATPLLLAALAIVVVAWWLGRVLGARVHLSRLRRHNPYVDVLLARLLRWMLLLVGLVLALDLLDATTLVGALLGSAGVVGLVLGFAFKDIAENYVAGILLSLRRPFAPGDLLLIDRYEGKVVALTSRATLLMTLDGNQLSLPNALVFKSVVLNYSANPNRRFDFTIPIARGASIRETQEVALAELRGIDGVLADPGPSWQVEEFGEAWIRLRFFGWMDQRSCDPGKVRSEAIRAVKAALERAGASQGRADVAAAAAGAVEPPHDATRPGDTSVNHDIDAQLDADRRALQDSNLL